MRMLAAGHERDINVTPMIDVLLTLMVVFIVLVQIRFVHSLQVPPAHAVTSPDTPKPIVLELLPGGGYEINGERISGYGLARRIGEVFAARPEKLLYVRVGEGWNYGQVMEAVDIARGAGVEQIGYVPPRATGSR